MLRRVWYWHQCSQCTSRLPPFVFDSHVLVCYGHEQQHNIVAGHLPFTTPAST